MNRNMASFVVRGSNGYELADDLILDGGDAACGAERGRCEHRSRNPQVGSRRRGGAAMRTTGIQCRRNRRWTWGKVGGVASQLMASCVVLALTLTAGSASADSITFVPISNPGNVASTKPNNVGTGSVAYDFAISQSEITVSQYASFLSSVGSSNATNIYNSSMATIGLTQSGSEGSYTYSVDPSLANRPIAYVTWMSAARFANWLNNGGTSSSSTETGAYTLSLSGTVPVARNPGAVVFLPNQDEWYKAAFYSPTLNSGAGGYYQYQTASDTTPTVATTGGPQLNTANYNNGIGATTDVGTFGAASQSYYAVNDMLGNVAEWTDSVNGTNQARILSGGYTATLATFDASAAAIYRSGSQNTAFLGFRVAAVPEPSTYALACFGMAGVAGARWLKRRRPEAAAPALAC